jgi:hypothetical protein
MLIVKVADAVRFPVSKRFTQNVPGSTVTLICAAEPGVTFSVELVTLQLVVELNVPNPNPTVTTEGVFKLASVTLTEPDCFTVNEKTFDPCTASVPENVSVGVVLVGVVGEASSNSPHPDATTAVRINAVRRDMRRV